MTSLSHLATALQQVLQLDPLTVASTSGFCQRRSKCTAALFVQTTVLGWAANPQASLAELVGVSAAAGVRLSAQALDQRLRSPAAAHVLEAVLAQAVQRAWPGLPATLPLLQRFPGVVLLDSTTVVLPDALAPLWAGCGGSHPTNTQAALKLSVRLDLVTGQLDGPWLSPGRQQDRATPAQHQPVPPGALRIADRGFWSLAILGQIGDQAGHFLSYLPVQTVLLDPVTHQRLALLSWLETHADGAVEGGVIDQPVLLGQRAQLPARLIAIREPAATARTRATRLRVQARRKGTRPSRRALARAGWTLLVTSVPAERLTAPEARALLAARWQLELLFKCWKQLAGLAVWRTTDPTRIRCEVLAKALGCVLQHWLVCTAWARPDRSVTHLLALVRPAMVALLLALSARAHLLRFLGQLADALARLPGVQPRPHRPATFQQLTNAPNVA